MRSASRRRPVVATARDRALTVITLAANDHDWDALAVVCKAMCESSECHRLLVLVRFPPPWWVMAPLDPSPDPRAALHVAWLAEKEAAADRAMLLGWQYGLDVRVVVDTALETRRLAEEYSGCGAQVISIRRPRRTIGRGLMPTMQYLGRLINASPSRKLPVVRSEDSRHRIARDRPGQRSSGAGNVGHCAPLGRAIRRIANRSSPFNSSVDHPMSNK
jgi:hypothetical protein